ncbi:MAG: glutamate-cysteine ligase family protein [Marmoricola sp.]
MDASQIQPHAARLFRGQHVRRTRVAVEHELLVSDAAGRTVPVETLRGLATGDYRSHLTFEPGGQVELSLPCASSPAAVAARLAGEVTALTEDLGRAGIRLLDLPLDVRPESQVPLRLRTSRYVAMQRHFDTVGPAGRRMMRRTASTQVCLDWWSGPVGLEQWRVLNLAAPFLAAAFARTAPAGRLATWLEVDPARTGFDDRLLAGPDPVTAYAAFAAGAKVFTAPGDAEAHLSTLFPPVRPRGTYLEARFLDVQPLAQVEHVTTVLASLLYDDERRRTWLGRLAGSQPHLASLWHAAAAGDAEVIGVGREIARTQSRVAA